MVATIHKSAHGCFDSPVRCVSRFEVDMDSKHLGTFSIYLSVLHQSSFVVLLPEHRLPDAIFDHFFPFWEATSLAQNPVWGFKCFAICLTLLVFH